MDLPPTPADDACAGRGRRAPLAMLALVNGVLGVLIVLLCAVDWIRGRAPDLEGASRMATFAGIAGMGFAQLALSRGRPGARRVLLVTALWTLVWAVVYLAQVVR